MGNTYEPGEYCFGFLCDHVYRVILPSIQELRELAIQVDSNYEEGHFTLSGIHLPKDLILENEQELLALWIIIVE